MTTLFIEYDFSHILLVATFIPIF